MALDNGRDATWGNLRPFILPAMAKAIALLQRPPDRLIEGLHYRNAAISLDGGNDALEERALCLLADLVLVLAMMEANNDSR